MAPPWQETPTKVVVEFQRSAQGAKRQILLKHSAQTVPPQLQGRVSPELWSSFISEVTQLSLTHPYVVPPGAKKVGGWLAGACVGVVLGFCCVDPDGGEYATWLPQLDQLVARHRQAFAACGVALALQRAQQSYWIQADVDPAFVVGKQAPFPAQLAPQATTKDAHYAQDQPQYPSVQQSGFPAAPAQAQDHAGHKTFYPEELQQSGLGGPVEQPSSQYPALNQPLGAKPPPATAGQSSYPSVNGAPAPATAGQSSYPSVNGAPAPAQGATAQYPSVNQPLGATPPPASAGESSYPSLGGGAPAQQAAQYPSLNRSLGAAPPPATAGESSYPSLLAGTAAPSPPGAGAAPPSAYPSLGDQFPAPPVQAPSAGGPTSGGPTAYPVL